MRNSRTTVINIFQALSRARHRVMLLYLNFRSRFPSPKQSFWKSRKAFSKFESENLKAVWTRKHLKSIQFRYRALVRKVARAERTHPEDRNGAARIGGDHERSCRQTAGCRSGLLGWRNATLNRSSRAKKEVLKTRFRKYLNLKYFCEFNLLFKFAPRWHDGRNAELAQREIQQFGQTIQVQKFLENSCKK